MEQSNQKLEITPQYLESLSKSQLIELVLFLVQRIQVLEEKIVLLNKNSSTSSKPPSSDIVKPQKADKTEVPRKIGGQKGHTGTTHQPVSVQAVNQIEEYDIKVCSVCNQDVLPERVGNPIIHQVVEIPAKLITITEHRSYGHLCPNCHKVVYAPFPEQIIPHQLCGPRLQALIAYMKGNLHASYTNLSLFINDILGLEISRSTVCNIISQVNKALFKPYEEVKEYISN